MKQRIALVAVVVADYDEAIAWYTQKLGFVLVEDTPMTPGKRWVVVKPAKAANEQQKEAIGRQTGGRVFLFLHTDDFQRDHTIYKKRGVAFVEGPREEPYGSVAVFTDLYGNRWDLIEPKAGKSSE
jgi:catechol 2,3-dioxygenase-like lactoylglutathione lyase family enzyme